MLHWSLSNGHLLSSDHTLAILSCLSSVLCNSQLVTMLSERESASLVCSATAAVHALVCSRECHRHRCVITDCCENLHFYCTHLGAFYYCMSAEENCTMHDAVCSSICYMQALC